MPKPKRGPEQEAEQETEHEPDPRLAELWRVYNLRLCCALFGFYDRQPEFDSEKLYDFLKSIFALSNSPERTSLAPPMDHVHLLDAGYIESHGPFVFYPTQSINDHLMIMAEDNKIRIYIYTNPWLLAVLRDHKVLQEEIVTDSHRPSRKNRDRVIAVLESYQTLNTLLFGPTSG